MEINNTKRKNSEGDINTASIHPTHVLVRYMDVATAAIIQAVLFERLLNQMKIYRSKHILNVTALYEKILYRSINQISLIQPKDVLRKTETR